MILKEEEIKLLKSIKGYFAISVGLFLLSILLGIIFVNFYPSIATKSLKEITDAFSFLHNLGPVTLGGFIFLNNSVKVFLFMALGVLFALPTLFFLVVNGWVLGFVAALMYPELGPKGLFFGLFFHGVFELLAMFIGSSMGILIGITVFSEVRGKATKIFPVSKKIRKILLLTGTIFVKVIIPLLFVAAVIETYIIFT